MSARKRPTRRDLLLVIGELQDIIGRVEGAFSDKNENRARDILDLSQRGFQLALDARNFDPPINGGSRGGWPYPGGK